MGRMRLSEQLRRAIADSGYSQPRICEWIELDRAAMHRFMRGEGGLSLDVLDQLADLLCLDITMNPPKKARPKMTTVASDQRNYRLRFINNQFDDLIEIPPEGITKKSEAETRRQQFPPGSTLSHYRISILTEPATTENRRHVQQSTPAWVYTKFGLARPAGR